MHQASSAPPPSDLVIRGDGQRLALEGSVGIATLGHLQDALRQGQGPPPTLDLGKLSSLDTPGALLLCRLRKEGFTLAAVREEHQALLDLICGLELQPLAKSQAVPRWRELVIQMGKGSDEAWRDLLELIAFVGRGLAAVGHGLTHPRSLRPASISRQIAETGVYALPIIGLMSVMISVVIGYQSVAQLRHYGGETFTIDLVAVSVLREMGVLITAIMVAGRSGSAFTAEIGMMRAHEEIDALKGIGMDPMAVLVVPRLIGLVITLPLLTFYADIMGLAGGAAITHALMDVSSLQYVERVHLAVDASDLFVGLVKAPIFAFFIASIGCMHGLRGKASAESVGRETTRAVVKAIFLVIVLDALFSILFEKLGL
jgi:phospholipid/cholesterol/gamma-HCH transport system permease protein